MASNDNNPENYARIRSILNRENDELPFGFYSPDTDGKLTWNCGMDQENRIVSIFCFDYGTHKDKKVAELKSKDDAIYARDQLIEAGWRPLEAPKVEVKYADGTTGPLTRKQKRYLSRKLKKLSENDPFAEDDSSQTEKKE